MGLIGDMRSSVMVKRETRSSDGGRASLVFSYIQRSSEALPPSLIFSRGGLLVDKVTALLSES